MNRQACLYAVVQTCWGQLALSDNPAKHIGTFVSFSDAMEQAKKLYVGWGENIVVGHNWARCGNGGSNSYHCDVIEIPIPSMRISFSTENYKDLEMYDRKRTKAQDFGSFPPPMNKEDY